MHTLPWWQVWVTGLRGVLWSELLQELSLVLRLFPYSVVPEAWARVKGQNILRKHQGWGLAPSADALWWQLCHLGIHFIQSWPLTPTLSVPVRPRKDQLTTLGSRNMGAAYRWKQRMHSPLHTLGVTPSAGSQGTCALCTGESAASHEPFTNNKPQAVFAAFCH